MPSANVRGIRRGAGGELAVVDLALKRRRRVVGREHERRRTRIDRRLRRRRVDRERLRSPASRSTLPAASFARTENVCVPSVNVRASGEVHAANSPSSTLHSNVAVASLDEKTNGERTRIDRRLRRRGVDRERLTRRRQIDVARRILRPHRERVRTRRRTCGRRGEVQAANSPSSTLHSNVAVASLDENTNGDGPESIVVSGAVVSTVNVLLAGVRSTLPVASVARTEKVWVPSANVTRVRRRTRRELAVVDLALKRRRRVVGRENERRRTRIDRRLRRRRIDRERARGRGRCRRSRGRRRRVSPSGNVPGANGDTHAVKAPASIAHSNVLSGSVDVKVNGGRLERGSCPDPGRRRRSACRRRRTRRDRGTTRSPRLASSGA